LNAVEVVVVGTATSVDRHRRRSRPARTGDTLPAVPTRTLPRRSRRLAAAGLVAALGALLSGCGLFDDPNAASQPLPPPPETDVPYGPAVGCDGLDDGCGGSQQVDIYRSDEPGPNPVLLFFHGGGFVGGDKVGSISEHLQAALDDGWDIVSVNYRLTTPDGTNAFPAAVSDAKRAVRWVKANAAAQDWDPANVAAMGHSAGGNLAGMLGVTADSPQFEAPDLPPELAATDSSVIAVVALNPVSDLTLFGANPDWTRAMQHYTGCTGECTAAFEAGSVQTHVDPASAPMLAMHGDKDLLAAPIQGVLVQDSYRNAGIGDRFELVIVDDGPDRFQGHEIDYDRFAGRFVDFLDAQRS
jgi:acetyl esterase/lipase